MTQKVSENNRVKKEYSARGQRSQRMLNFRCDLDNWEKLQTKPNKGRFINEALRKALSE